MLALVYAGSPERLLMQLEHFENMEIPSTDDDNLLFDMGFLLLRPNMAVLYRNLNGSGKAEDDIPKVWVEDEGKLHIDFESSIAQLRAALAILLGPTCDLHGADPLGSALERSLRGHGNLQGGR